jgi:6-phosphogluconolactonase
MGKSNIPFPAHYQNTSVSFHTFEELARLTLPYLSKGAIALSGGSTYGRLFPLWAGLSPDCREAMFYPVDERIVPFDDPQSNWGIAYRQFLSRVGRSSDKDNFAISADSYRDLLKKRFLSDIPVFDVIFLGVGDDGHTASLFPGEPYLDDLTSVVLETQSPKPPVQRVTLAMAPLIAAKTLITIIAGKEKKPIMKKLIRNNQNLPVSLVITRRMDSVLFIEKDLIP